MPVFHHPRRVQVDTGADPLVPALGAAVLALVAAAAYALMSWLGDVLGALGEVPVPTVALVPGALGFTGAGYLLGRCRIVQLERREARELPPGAPPAVIVAVPVRPALSQPSKRPVTSITTARTVPANRRARAGR